MERQKGGDVGDGAALAERIARLVHAHFDGLPARSKPILRDDGTREWIPMCGVVVVRGVYILSLHYLRNIWRGTMVGCILAYDMLV